jgi:hypothetical protein
MSKTSTTQISVSTIGDGVLSTDAPPATINIAAPSGGPVAVALALGDNTIAVPSGATGMVLIPSSSSTNAKRLKGLAGDTGFALRPNEPASIPLPASTTTVLLNSAAAETVFVHWT